jgi:phosphate-selective porin OprO/OprP
MPEINRVKSILGLGLARLLLVGSLAIPAASAQNSAEVSGSRVEEIEAAAAQLDTMEDSGAKEKEPESGLGVQSRISNEATNTAPTADNQSQTHQTEPIEPKVYDSDIEDMLPPQKPDDETAAPSAAAESSSAADGSAEAVETGSVTAPPGDGDEIETRTTAVQDNLLPEIPDTDSDTESPAPEKAKADDGKADATTTKATADAETTKPAPAPVEPEVYDSDVEDMLPPKPAQSTPPEITKPTPTQTEAVEKQAPGPAAAETKTVGPAPTDQAPTPDATTPESKAAQPGKAEAPAPAVTQPAPAKTEPFIIAPGSWQEKWIEPWNESWIDEQEEWGVSGLRFVDHYGLLRIKLGGNLAVDYGALHQTPSLDSAYPDFSGTEVQLRSARALLVGNFGPHIFFKFAYDAASVSTGFKDAYVVVQNVPFISNLRLGRGEQPFSMENLKSLRFSSFMEGSLAMALVPGRSFGLMANDTAFERRVTWATGLFYRSAQWSDFEFDTSDGADISARVTGLPYFESSEKMLHLGFNVAKRKYGDIARISSAPESRLTDTLYVDTGNFEADYAVLYGAEAAWQYGPLSIRGEYTRANINTDVESSVARGGYVKISYALTGEHHPYNRAAANFGPLVPSKPFEWGGSAPGAWELALRYSSLDTNNLPTPGGREHNFTLGLGWYTGRNVRLLFNYIHGKVDSLASGSFNIFQARVFYWF